MGKRRLTVFVVGVVLLIAAIGLSTLRGRSLATEGPIFTREEAVSRAIYQVGTGAKTQLVDVRLLKHEEANGALGGRPGYEQMKNYPYKPDTPTWAVTLLVEGGVAIFDDNKTAGVIYLLVAGDGKPEFTAGVDDPYTNSDALRMRKLPDLDGKLEIVPIPIPTSGPLYPTATPVPVGE